MDEGLLRSRHVFGEIDCSHQRETPPGGSVLVINGEQDSHQLLEDRLSGPSAFVLFPPFASTEPALDRYPPLQHPLQLHWTDPHGLLWNAVYPTERSDYLGSLFR